MSGRDFWNDVSSLENDVCSYSVLLKVNAELPCRKSVWGEYVRTVVDNTNPFLFPSGVYVELEEGRRYVESEISPSFYVAQILDLSNLEQLKDEDELNLEPNPVILQGLYGRFTTKRKRTRLLFDGEKVIVRGDRQLSQIRDNINRWYLEGIVEIAGGLSADDSLKLHSEVFPEADSKVLYPKRRTRKKVNNYD